LIVLAVLILALAGLAVRVTRATVGSVLQRGAEGWRLFGRGASLSG
jgi:hypothetical protein